MPETKMILALVAALGLLLSACPGNGDDDSGAGDDDTSADPCTAGSPTASIDQPSNGASFSVGEMINFQAQVADDADPPSSLDVVWMDKVDGEETEFAAPAPDANGVITFQSDDFSQGTHIITLIVTDSDGCEMEEDTSFSVGV